MGPRKIRLVHLIICFVYVSLTGHLNATIEKKTKKKRKTTESVVKKAC